MIHACIILQYSWLLAHLWHQQGHPCVHAFGLNFASRHQHDVYYLLIYFKKAVVLAWFEKLEQSHVMEIKHVRRSYWISSLNGLCLIHTDDVGETTSIVRGWTNLSRGQIYVWWRANGLGGEEISKERNEEKWGNGQKEKYGGWEPLRRGNDCQDGAAKVKWRGGNKEVIAWYSSNQRCF